MSSYLNICLVSKDSSNNEVSYKVLFSFSRSSDIYRTFSDCLVCTTSYQRFTYEDIINVEESLYTLFQSYTTDKAMYERLTSLSENQEEMYKYTLERLKDISEAKQQLQVIKFIYKSIKYKSEFSEIGYYIA